MQNLSASKPLDPTQFQQSLSAFYSEFLSAAARVVARIVLQHTSTSPSSAAIKFDSAEVGSRSIAALSGSSGVYTEAGITYKLLSDPSSGARKAVSRALLHSGLALSCRVPQLCVPFSAVFDVRGVSVLCTAGIFDLLPHMHTLIIKSSRTPGIHSPSVFLLSVALPLDSSSLIQGLTADGSRLLCAPEFAPLLIPIARHLNLKPHSVALPAAPAAASTGAVNVGLSVLHADLQGFKCVFLFVCSFVCLCALMRPSHLHGTVL